MTAAADFLRAIKAAPDDDAPRLVYADWLDERGQPERAEFVRVQCEVARLGTDWIDFASGPLAAEYPDIHDERDWQKVTDTFRRRERELFSVWLWHWLPGWLTKPNDDKSWDVRRGFLHGVRCEAADWLSHGDELVAAHPVREVRLLSCWTPLPRSFREHCFYRDPDSRPSSFPTSRHVQAFVDRFGDFSPPQRIYRHLAKPAGVNNRSYASFTEALDDMQSGLEAEWPGITFDLPREDMIRAMQAFCDPMFGVHV